MELKEGARVLQSSAPGGADRRVLARGQDWLEVSVDGDTVWVLARNRGRSRLLRTTLRGGEPETVLTGLPSAGGLLAEGGQVFWIELLPGLPGLIAVPSAGPTCRLRRLQGSGAETLAQWPGSDGGRADQLDFEGRPILEEGRGAPIGPMLPGEDDLIGISGGTIYARARRAASTEFLAIPQRGGPAARVGAEGGTQVATLHAGVLCWTGPSDEANPRVRVRCVRRAAAGGAERVSEWLPRLGRLVSLPDGLYYVSGPVFRLPERLGPPEYRGSIIPQYVETDGRQPIGVGEPGAPKLVEPVR